VTFTLDLLLQRGFPIGELVVIHPDASRPRLRHALECLNAEFVADRYRMNGQTIHFRSHTLQLNNRPLDDIIDEVSAEGAFNTIHQLIRNLKYQHRHIHLSITGGRRLMSSIATEAALLNFTHFDHIWHIYTPEAVQKRASEGACMHVCAQDGVHLIERHFVPWGTYFSDLPQTINTAQEAACFQEHQMDILQRTRCEQVIRRATEREVEVLRAFAQGNTIQEVADCLCISTRTVDAHKTKLLDLCREIWAIEQQASRLGYHFLYKNFGPYFAGQQQ
jgi:CRISPR-associated protein Csx14